MSAPRWLVAVIVIILSILTAETYVYSLEKQIRMKVLRAQFILMVLTLMMLLSIYAWKQLVTKPAVYAAACGQKQTTLFRIWRILLICFLACVHSSYLTSYLLVGTEPHWFTLLCFSALGTFIHVMMFLVCLGALEFFISILSKPRRFYIIKNPKIKAILACMCGLSLSLHGIYSASQPPRIEYITIPIHKLPSSLDRLTIVQLTDIHLGPTVGKSQMTQVVDIVNTLHPDIVAIIGDLVDSSVATLAEAASPLRDLRTRHGKYFVTGNHEYYTGDAERWLIYLKELGVIPLHNENVKIFRNKNSADHICLAGTDDIQADKIKYTGHGMKLNQALDSCDRRYPIILLAHQPNAAKKALESFPEINLVLSGHTHGGQLYPMIVGAYLLNAYYAGLYQPSNTSYVYVSKGTFYFGIPMKIHNTLEITHITLRKKM